MVCLTFVIIYAKSNTINNPTNPKFSATKLIGTSYDLFYRAIAMSINEFGLWIQWKILEQKIDEGNVSFKTLKKVFESYFDSKKIITDREKYKIDSKRFINDTIQYVSYYYP